ncbi:hypothetical protein Plhal304r1_c062g0149911 [Plasmopara halstedii]
MTNSTPKRIDEDLESLQYRLVATRRLKFGVCDRRPDRESTISNRIYREVAQRLTYSTKYASGVTGAGESHEEYSTDMRLRSFSVQECTEFF